MNSALARAYAGKRVLVTGHSGFKGAWLTLWLNQLGARVYGFALPAEERALPNTAGIAPNQGAVEGDLRSMEAVQRALDHAQPDIVLHLAAQALVRKSYREPLDTFATNAMGTAHVLEAIRSRAARCAVVIVSSDKCYENREQWAGYREDDALGGHDVYSMSKAATELVTASWRRSFFDPSRLAQHGVAIGSARAGNVIGGGDWGAERLMPDIVSSLQRGEPIGLRNPTSVRPWQHVLEPLSGYLMLGAALMGPEAATCCEAFNFGPAASSAISVRDVVQLAIDVWGEGRWEAKRDPTAPHEAKQLRLSIDKAQAVLGWSPRWNVHEAVHATVEWYREQANGAAPHHLRSLCEAQLERYAEDVAVRRAA